MTLSGVHLRQSVRQSLAGFRRQSNPSASLRLIFAMMLA
jgi:hypothetical protein